jgi:hypothetical protein
MTQYGKLLVRARMLSNPTWQQYWLDYHALKCLIYKIKSEKETKERMKSVKDKTQTKENDKDSSDEEQPATTTAATITAGDHSPPTDNKTHITSISTTNTAITTTSDTKTSTIPSEVSSSTISLAEQSRVFFQKLTVELNKVSNFYNNQEQILLGRTAIFSQELRAAETQSYNDQDIEEREARVITLSRLMESCKVLYVDLMMLENFAGMYVFCSIKVVFSFVLSFLD